MVINYQARSYGRGSSCPQNSCFAPRSVPHLHVTPRCISRSSHIMVVLTDILLPTKRTKIVVAADIFPYLKIPKWFCDRAPSGKLTALTRPPSYTWRRWRPLFGGKKGRIRKGRGRKEKGDYGMGGENICTKKGWLGLPSLKCGCPRNRSWCVRWTIELQDHH